MSEVEMEFHPNLYSNNPKHYDLFFCGDSWTYGGELDQFNPKLYDYRRKHRFSNVVSQKLNKTFYNLSIGGASNDWIVQHAVDWFEKGNSCDVAVIQFSKNSRIGFFDKGRYYTRQLIQIKDDLPEFFINDYNMHQSYKKNLFFLDSYLKSKNIKTIYLTIQEKQKFGKNKPEYWDLYCKSIKVQNLADIMQLDRKNNFIKPQTHIHWMLNGHHPSVEGHIEIAKYIIDRINKL